MNEFVDDFTQHMLEAISEPIPPRDPNDPSGIFIDEDGNTVIRSYHEWVPGLWSGTTFVIPKEKDGNQG